MNTNTNKIGTNGSHNEAGQEIDDVIAQVLPSGNSGIRKVNSANTAGIPKKLQKVLLQVGKLKRSF